MAWNDLTRWVPDPRYFSDPTDEPPMREFVIWHDGSPVFVQARSTADALARYWGDKGGDAATVRRLAGVHAEMANTWRGSSERISLFLELPTGVGDLDDPYLWAAAMTAEQFDAFEAAPSMRDAIEYHAHSINRPDWSGYTAADALADMVDSDREGAALVRLDREEAYADGPF
jgi:hypothetical protein